MVLRAGSGGVASGGPTNGGGRRGGRPARQREDRAELKANGGGVEGRGELEVPRAGSSRKGERRGGRSGRVP